MERKSLNSPVCPIKGAPLTSSSLGNSLQTFNKFMMKQINLRTAGLEALSENISELSMPRSMTEMHNNEISNYNAAGCVAKNILGQCKQEDVKFALLFKLKKDELKQVQNGDTSVLATCLQSVAEGTILNDNNYHIIPNAQLCTIVEKIRQTVMSEAHMMQKNEGAANQNRHGIVLAQYKKPKVSDKSTQYENPNVLSESSETSFESMRIENSSTGVVNALNEQRKIIRQDKEITYNATYYEKSNQNDNGSAPSPHLSTLSLLKEDEDNDNSSLCLADSSLRVPQNSLVIIRKRLGEKQLEFAKPKMEKQFPQFFCDGIVKQIQQENGSDLEWLEEETEPDFESIGDDQKSEEEIIGDAGFLSLNKQNKPHEQQYEQLHTQFSFKMSNDALIKTSSTVLNDMPIPRPTSPFANCFEEVKNCPSTSIKNEIETEELRTEKPTKIPIPVHRKSCFEVLLKRLKDQNGQSPFTTSPSHMLQSSPSPIKKNLQSVCSEGNICFADALHDCPKETALDTVQSFKQNLFRDSKTDPETYARKIANIQRKRKTRVPVLDRKQMKSPLARERKYCLDNELAAKAEETKNLTESNVNGIVVTKDLTHTSNMNLKQRHLVQLIARGIESEMLSNLKKSKLKQKLASQC